MHPPTPKPTKTILGTSYEREDLLRQEAEEPHPLAPVIGGAYERFFELPEVFVLAVLWMMGAVLLGLSALVVYWSAWVLLRLGAGFI